jgi:signal transduction histidine kinase
MSSIYTAINTILISPAGSLMYHLILAFAIAWALHGAITLWRNDDLHSARRLTIGLALLLASRIALFTAGVLVSTGLLASAEMLPSLDRAASALGLVIILWMWAFPEPLRLADAASILLGLLVVTLLALSLTWANAQFSGIPFNSTPLNSLWEGFSLLIAAAGILFLVIRRPPSWEYGLGLFVILFAGSLVQLFWPVLDQDIPPAVRLAQIAAYPILLALPQRYFSGASFRDIGRGVESRIGASQALQMLAAWFDIEQLETSSAAMQSLPEFLCAVYDVEAAAVLIPAEPAGREGTLAGYIRRKDERVSNIGIADTQVPILWNAMQRGRPMRLHASSSSADLDHLCDALGIGHGNLLAVPLISSQKILLAGMLLFSFEPSRTWTNEDQSEAVELAGGFARGLERLVGAEPTAPKPVEMETSVEQPVTTLAPPDEAEITERLAALEAENEHLILELNRWQVSSSPEQVAQLEAELRQSLVELAFLQKKLSEADEKYLQAAEQADGEHLEVVMSIVQDLRQPMSSIVGYTDLLLGESVGILGALQRKFLERIKASTERMSALVEDLVQVTAMNQEEIELKPVEVDLNAVIDEAITHTSARMIEKNIALRVDIPTDLPPIKADQDALQQVVIHLLQNAGAASPAEGEIILAVQNAQDELQDQDYVLLQVTDSGGGIPSEDLPRVFSRLYRADNPLIQGVGDTGVGLSVAKNLVEALNGRIWVDTEMGTGSTFSVLLPVSANGMVEEAWDL